MLLHLLLIVKGKPAHIGAGRMLPAPFQHTPGLFSGAGYLSEVAGHKKTPGCFAGPGVSKKPPGKPNGRRFAVSAQLPATAAYWAGW